MLGKMLNKNEIAHIVSMYEYLRLSPEYIEKMFDYCIKTDKKSVVYIARMVYSMFENDITTVEELESHLAKEEIKNDILYGIKELFGIGARALTSKEKNSFTKWIEEYDMSFEMIKEAYEITVDRTGESAIGYMGAILKRWHSEGFTTVEETKAEAESYKASQKEKENKDKKQLGNFDEDEFMTAAIKRSYKDKK
jgi:DnaD/phage-associated family protein